MMVCFSLPGLQKIYFSKDSSDINYAITTGNTVVLNASYPFTELAFEQASFNQKRINDQRGKYYSKEINIVSDSFIDDSVYDLENESLLILFLDNNGNYWITGMEKPFTISKMDSSNNGSDVKVELVLSQSSYLSVQPINIPQATITL